MNNFFDVWSNIFFFYWRCFYKDCCVCIDICCRFYFFSVCECWEKYFVRWCVVRCWCSCCLGKFGLCSVWWYCVGCWCIWFYVGCYMWCYSWCSNRWSSCGSCWCVCGIGLCRSNSDIRIEILYIYWGIFCKMYKVRNNDNLFVLKKNWYFIRFIYNILLNMWLNY